MFGFLVPFIRHYRSLGWQVDGLASGLPGDLSVAHEFNHCFDAMWSRSLRGIPSWGAAARQVREVAWSGQYDIIHIHTPIASFVTRFALRTLRRETGTKIVYTAHGFHFHPKGNWWWNAVFRWAERLAGHWTDRLVVINQTDYVAAVEHRILPKGQVVHMPGIGLDLEEFSQRSSACTELESLRASIGLKPSDFVVLVIAEFNPGKRHRDVIKAIASLGDPRVKLVIAGKGATEDKCKALAKSLGVAERVIFLGFRSDVPILIRASQAMLLASEREGLPRSLMEAMASGLPAIGAKIRGTADLLGDGCGVLVELGDSVGYAQAIRLLMENAKLANEIATCAKEKITGYSIQSVIRKHDQMYGELLAADSPDPLSAAPI